jgi:hypothetical protein
LIGVFREPRGEKLLAAAKTASERRRECCLGKPGGLEVVAASRDVLTGTAVVVV